jgi:flavin reductase (DIM6/NTAB) family NADH-FMN oxidoreductase RutF
MRAFRKKDFPAEEVGWFLEPGPIVLASSAWKGERNIMTLGWHMILGFAPSLVGWSRAPTRPVSGAASGRTGCDGAVP